MLGRKCMVCLLKSCFRRRCGKSSSGLLMLILIGSFEKNSSGQSGLLFDTPYLCVLALFLAYAVQTLWLSREVVNWALFCIAD